MNDLLRVVLAVGGAATALYLLAVVVLALTYQLPNMISTTFDRWAVRHYRKIEQR